MRVLITGGAGFLGSHLCDAMLAEGHFVVCVDNLLTGRMENLAHLARESRFAFVRQDVCQAFDPGKIDYIFNFASPASPIDYLEHGIETLQAGSAGTINCLELAKKYNAQFLLASTSECYGDPLEHPQTESYWGHVNPIGPRSVYDEAKRFAEAATMAYHRYRGVDTRIVRIFNTYGPRLQINDGRVISNFMVQALQGQTPHRLWRWVTDTQLLLCERRGRGDRRAVEIQRTFAHKHRQSHRIHHAGMRTTCVAGHGIEE